uniref:Uncharacterized protein n=1 Tax=Arundo donax TaxID=35708 RepID=A0A0A9EMP4_ARUDO
MLFTPFVGVKTFFCLVQKNRLNAILNILLALTFQKAIIINVDTFGQTFLFTTCTASRIL